MYNNNYQGYNTFPNYKNQDRQFLFPFLLGGLGGAAIVGASRPRPVYVNSPASTYYPQYGYNYYGGYNYTPYPTYYR
jgi:hypothetical protein